MHETRNFLLVILLIVSVVAVLASVAEAQKVTFADADLEASYPRAANTRVLP